MTARGAHLALIAGLLLSSSMLAQEPGEFSLRLNIPAYRLEALDGGRTVMTVRVAVGAREYPTPAGAFAVSVITWNPWWFPPNRPWAADDTVTPPCPQNPVGRVKLGFAPLYFIHGTPAERSLGHAASHGCVRVGQDDVVALAALVVRRVLPDSVGAAAAYAAGSETRSMRLPVPVPLEIRYQLAEVRRDTLWLYPDIYRRTPRLDRRIRLAAEALASAGRAGAVESAQLQRLVSRSRSSVVAVPLR